MHVDEKMVQFLKSKGFELQKSDLITFCKLENKYGWSIYIEEMSSNEHPEVLVFTIKEGLCSRIEKANLQALKYVLS